MRDVELKNNKRRKDIKEDTRNERNFISAKLNFLSDDIKNYTRAGMSFNLALQMCEILPLVSFPGRDKSMNKR